MTDEIIKLINNGDYIHICQGCGEVINLDVDHSDKLIEFVKTHSETSISSIKNVPTRSGVTKSSGCVKNLE